MFPYLRIGPFLLQLPGLALLLGVWVGISLAEKQALARRLDASAVYNMIFAALVAGVVGARLGYAAQYASIYLDTPLQLFALNPQTLSLPSGLLFAAVAAALYGYRRKLPLLPTLDVLGIGGAALAVFIGVAHLLSGDAFGSPTDLPWAVYLWDEYRHPAQVYEILLALGVLALVLRQSPRRRRGEVFLLTVAGSAAARLFLEAFRGDSPLTPGGFRIPQLLSLLILAAVWMVWPILSTRNAVPAQRKTE